jgi:DNA-binding LytR/AlgR family response regulator
MKKYNCLIIDDERLARNLVSNFVGKIDYLEEIGSFSGVLSAKSILESGKVDILFLDIQMNEQNGLEYLNQSNNKIITIITTAYKQHALDAYNLDVVDYLLKPFTFERFFQAINKSMKLLNPDEPTTFKEYLTVQSNHKLLNINFKDIDYIESLGEYAKFYLENGKKLVAIASLKNLEDILPVDFIRVHKSFIVSISKIKELEGNTIRISDHEIPVGRSYKKQLLSSVFNR